MRFALIVGLLSLATGCSYFQTKNEPAKPESAAKTPNATEMTCYQDCRADMQSDEFCRARCTD